ncbi:MAG: class I SAM-dependent methyltransferase [Bacteroidales bacterium]|nr:class I SAM-dependent methyltransferase [Bacteroidales bacterium]MDZ4204602.1 class I SAM-dependent methyltransferase [Bacteroidales bacterium]
MIRLIVKYVCYLFRAKSKFGIHSPFVFQFVNDVLNDKTVFSEYQTINKTMQKFHRSRNIIETTDFGACTGQNTYRTHTRRVKEIARLSAISESIGRLLFKMVRYYKPEHILELGTSLGISTLYLALANPDARVITIEGCANTAESAQNNFDQHNLKNIQLQVGEFGNLLEKAIESLPHLDFVFIDGNHRKEPTLSYFNTCLPKAHNETIFVFDDIYWSKGMEQAWCQIKAHPRVTASIDLFSIGIVFFRKELSKEDFVIRLL